MTNNMVKQRKPVGSVTVQFVILIRGSKGTRAMPKVGQKITRKPYRIYNEDCLETISRMEDNSIHSIVTDPPAGIIHPPEQS